MAGAKVRGDKNVAGRAARRAVDADASLVRNVHIRPSLWSREARRPWTADGVPEGMLRKVPAPYTTRPRISGGPERAGKGAETTQPAPRMIRSAMTLARDLVRRRLPAGASPNGAAIAPGRTLSPMPSEQNGAYGGHLASYALTLHRTRPREMLTCENPHTPRAHLEPLHGETAARDLTFYRDFGRGNEPVA